MRVSGRLIMILLRLSHGYLQLPSGSQMWLGNPRSNGGFTGEIHENHQKMKGEIWGNMGKSIAMFDCPRVIASSFWQIFSWE